MEGIYSQRGHAHRGDINALYIHCALQYIILKALKKFSVIQGSFSIINYIKQRIFINRKYINI